MRFRDSCIDENPDELGETVRILFQNRGYFSAVVNNVKIKLIDPLARPQTVTVEVDVQEGRVIGLGAAASASRQSPLTGVTRFTGLFEDTKGKMTVAA